MIFVCDSIMGSGKSTSAINYMNSHPDKKFIYITPFLDEVERITKACPDLEFVTPSNKIAHFKYKKRDHAAYLIANGRNIASTHQALRGYSDEMIRDIKRKEYTLILDESIDHLEECDINGDDLRLAIEAGYLNESNGNITIGDRSGYKGKAISGILDAALSGRLIEVRDGNNHGYVYWGLSPELINAFSDVIVMTYLFDAQSLSSMFKIYNIEYKNIYTRKVGDTYEFCDDNSWNPDYVKHIKDKVHIYRGEKLNSVGDKKTALSLSWFNRGGKNVDELRRNVQNYLRNIVRVNAHECLWSTYCSVRDSISGKGFKSSFLQFNSRATNSYSDRHYLVYAVNLYMNVPQKLYYARNGVTVDEDMYALSVMVQWIWRSAIRNGEDIYIYIPSKRMRGILEDWLERLTNGGETE